MGSMLHIFSFASLSNVWNTTTTNTTTNDDKNTSTVSENIDKTTTTTGPLQLELSDRESYWIRRVVVLLMKHHLIILVATLYKDLVTYPLRVFTSFLSSSSSTLQKLTQLFHTTNTPTDSNNHNTSS